MLQYLAITFRHAAWFNFHSFIRTVSPQKPPSEWVVSHALRHGWPQFLVGSPESRILKKFLASKIHLDRFGYADSLGLEKALRTFHSPVLNSEKYFSSVQKNRQPQGKSDCKQPHPKLAIIPEKILHVSPRKALRQPSKIDRSRDNIYRQGIHSDPDEGQCPFSPCPNLDHLKEDRQQKGGVTARD
jgi:hypothetical protein